jgi:hypothetical protein
MKRLEKKDNAIFELPEELKNNVFQVVAKLPGKIVIQCTTYMFCLINDVKLLGISNL